MRLSAAPIAVTLLAGLSAYRARLVDEAYGRYAGCAGCFDMSVYANDALLLAALAALLAAARAFGCRALNLIAGLVAMAGVAAYAVDLLVFRLLAQRLSLADFLHYGGDASLLSSVAAPLLAQRQGLALAAALGLALALTGAAFLATARRPGHAAGWSAACTAFLALGLVTPRASYLHELAFMNFWQANAASDPSRAYTEAFWAANAAMPAGVLHCEAGPALQPSVVLVVVESLSAYHSKLASGVEDLTPRLDALAAKGTWFTNFRANAYSTEGALIALLTGRVPIPTAGRFGSTMAFTAVDGDFHRWLAAAGYRTWFFTSGDLAIGGRANWLRAIGVQNLEGAGHPFYRGMPRGPFSAADDAALVDRFLAWHERERPAGPFMATVLTVGTHPPFASPGHGIVGEAAAVRHADAQVARLAAELERRGFFRDGVLLIVGDHRAMTPIPPAEIAALGPSASMRVAAIALGNTGLAPGRNDMLVQQTDLIPSLRYLITGSSCRDEWQGRFLGHAVDPAHYVVTPDPIHRNELAVLEAEQEYRMLLDGDETRWRVAPRNREAAERLLRRVNSERMARMGEFRVAPRDGRRIAAHR